MRKPKVIVGMRFGRLITDIETDRKYKNGARYWECICDCGNRTITTNHALKTGHTKSCGCLRDELRNLTVTKHGHSRDYRHTPEYSCWDNLKRRCFNPQHHSYHNYGGRGISVCQEWNESFMAFFNHIGPRPTSKHTIDRINNDGNYEPGNVRWSTRSENLLNRRPYKRTK